jgi:DNA-directed RNA polymerase II subunit RPB2
MENDDELIWKIISSYFEDNPQYLVRHHIESYNDFFQNGIFQLFKEKNPTNINSKYDDTLKEFRHQCFMYFGGKKGDKVYFGKPIIYDNNNQHYMFPNEARLRNMTYGMTIHYDIEVDIIDILEEGESPSLPIEGGGRGRGREGEGEGYDHLIDSETNFKQNFKTMTGGIDQEPTKKKHRKTKAVQIYTTTTIATNIKETIEKSMIGRNIQKRSFTIEKIFLGKFPIMVQSKFCILNNIPRELRYNMGECKNDPGGYFIIDGKEKTIIPQEKFGDNMLYIRKSKDEAFLYSAEIRSVSENVSKPIRTLSVKIMAPTTKFSYKNIVVNIPNVRNPVPLFIVFRALGIISDKDIITICVLDIEKYKEIIDLLSPSVHDAGCVMTQQVALQYIASLTKHGTISYALNVLTDYLLPHVGEMNFYTKAYNLGYIVFRLLLVYSGFEQPTDRDHYKYKRIELVGNLLNDLFREYYTIYQKSIQLNFEGILFFNKSIYEERLEDLILDKYKEVFREREVENGFKKAFKGNWGNQSHTKRIGVVQDLNRLSFNSMISHLRKTNLPIDSSAKIVEPRALHSSQWGFIDPVDTPDGANIGIHKTLAIATVVSSGQSREPIIKWLLENTQMKRIEDMFPFELSKHSKIIINGLWFGVIDNPIKLTEQMKFYRRNALIPIHTSITFDIKLNTIYIYTDSGRICRPIFYKDVDTGHFSFDKNKIIKLLKDDSKSIWLNLTTGFNKKIKSYDSNKLYKFNELYENKSSAKSPYEYEDFITKKAIIDYIDPSESENALILMNPNDPIDSHIIDKYTHMEIHESLIFGVMCNQITFPENNQFPRNAFSCGQSKQAVSMYHTNFQVRMDKTAVVLNNGQIPLVKTRYLEHINKEENPYGENAIVAIMCYTGYNMEDSILINEASIKRGLFNTTYYTVYETHEERTKQGDATVEKIFTNFQQSNNSVLGKKTGYDYSKLDKWGIIQENTIVNDKTVLIGMSSNNVLNKENRLDDSKLPKKGQIGIIDKSFITEGEEGERIAKVRICEIRVPNIGDKMASRNGQKGTIGLVIPECDMPFTKDGLRPDLIINPHALPSRMTIGQLVECITGKACAMYGGFGDCTAFNNKGSKVGVFGEKLIKMGYHSSGNEILYDGMNGSQIEMEIFIGPTYYMRLKHMVKDKINYRARGPRTALTRQPVSGRANDGGLRIGEMERDVLLSHGMNDFMKESMLDRGDKFYMAICNQTGMLSIYNPSKNLFMSPMADGPIQFTGTIDGNSFTIEKITKFGRSFSIICVPYSLKLLLQELQTLNIQMRIITDDNIDQFDNLAFSNNINKLTNINHFDPKEIINQIKNSLKNNNNNPISQLPPPIVSSIIPPLPNISSIIPPLPNISSVIPPLPNISSVIPQLPNNISSVIPQLPNNISSVIPQLPNNISSVIPPLPSTEFTLNPIVTNENKEEQKTIEGGSNMNGGDEFYKIKDKNGDNIDIQLIDEFPIENIEYDSSLDNQPVSFITPNMICDKPQFSREFSENDFDYNHHYQPSNINVNPIIKIINGNDNSGIPDLNFSSLDELNNIQIPKNKNSTIQFKGNEKKGNNDNDNDNGNNGNENENEMKIIDTFDFAKPFTIKKV